jgi:hypothetical protein
VAARNNECYEGGLEFRIFQRWRKDVALEVMHTDQRPIPGGRERLGETESD